MRKTNEVVLHITHPFTRRLAYEVLYRRNLIRKKTKQKHKEDCEDFWWLVRKMDKGWFDSIPKGHTVYLGSEGGKSGYFPIFYLYSREG